MNLIQKILYESGLENENFMNLPYLQPRPEAKRKYQQILKERKEEIKKIIKKIKLGLKKIDKAFENKEYKNEIEQDLFYILANSKIFYDPEEGSFKIYLISNDNYIVIMIDLIRKIIWFDLSLLYEKDISLTFEEEIVEKYFDINNYFISSKFFS